MKKPIRIILLIFTLLWLAFLFDTQLIVLRDDGMFTLRYNVPDEMKGKMFTGASWYSNSLMCRQLSFGSGRFEGTTFGTSFRNVEEKPGEWVSHIPTKVWHPFCTWERGPLSIGVHANEEKTSHYELAYAYLFDEKKSDSENPAKQKKIEDGQNESFLVCDVSEFDYKKIYPDRKYIEKRRSYKCNNPRSRGATHMSATPSVGFYLKDYGKISILISKNSFLYLKRNYYDINKRSINSFDKKIKYNNDKVLLIDSSITRYLYWSIEKNGNSYVLTEGDAKLKQKKQKTIKLTPDQLTYLASEDVWELPDFLKQ
ncbi:hypothetical protein SAMN04488082_1013 [Desulfomicrobium apsheronum]|uniref:Uncharacterized protein n=1 Tax=Desulfomicrobium apsheronum TaxID=52560 RepID=A0A1I3MK66_9BACT|nr:hypothetical protein [Desulfomicrobium apsheronum]SFI97534.1 hypothetical protein SAMN04488082_1013 [Desulfomicrobium apsheronum]